MPKGHLIECKEDMEIVNFDVKFIEGKKYLLVPDQEGKYYVVDERHNPIRILIKELKRHFKI